MKNLARLAIFVLLVGAFAAADTVTFAPINYANSTDIGSSYTEGNYHFQSSGTFGTWGSSDGNGNYLGPNMFANQPGDTQTLTTVNSSPFSIQSIQMSSIYSSGGSETVHFVGTTISSGTVTFDASVNGFGWVTYYFPGTFDNLVSLTWDQNPSYSQYSDLVLNTTTTPEPAGLLLLGSGLIGAAGSLRRKLIKANPPSFF